MDESNNFNQDASTQTISQTNPKPTPPQTNYQPQTAAQPTPTPHKPKLPIILLIVLILILLGICGWPVYDKFNNSSNSSNNDTNSSNSADEPSKQTNTVSDSTTTNTPNQSTPLPKEICAEYEKICFNYPEDWSATAQTPDTQGLTIDELTITHSNQNYYIHLQTMYGVGGGCDYNSDPDGFTIINKVATKLGKYPLSEDKYENEQAIAVAAVLRYIARNKRGIETGRSYTTQFFLTRKNKILQVNPPVKLDYCNSGFAGIMTGKNHLSDYSSQGSTALFATYLKENNNNYPFGKRFNSYQDAENFINSDEGKTILNILASAHYK